jgi:hypothetical protein
MYIFLFYVRTHSFVKNIIFREVCKEDKKNSFMKRLILAAF